MRMALNLIGYCRVSTDEQALYGYGLDAQETKLRDYARRASAEMVVMRDEGISGKSLERPALMRALAKIAAGEADGLVVAKLDRLTRSVIDFAMLLEWFTTAKAQLVALDFDLDTSTPGGRLVAHIMSATAEWERSTIAQRTREALAAARARGKPIGPPAVGDRPALAIRIRGMRENGLTLQGICDALNTEGVPTARGGSMWRPSAVQSVLGHKRRPARKRIANLPELGSRRRTG
jgi:DNA invertase Pin-like site-specific DNA recombinase